MPVFAYRAAEMDRSPVAGSIVADTPRQARDLLRAKGMSISEIHAQRPQSHHPWWQLRRRQDAKVLSFIGELATLLGVGIPLLEAIDTIARGYRGQFKTALLLLHDRVAEGVSLADAMRQQPQMFDSLCVNMVEVGENAGTLDSVLVRLAEFRERSGQLKSRIGTALLYPSIVLLTGVAVSVFLMTFVVPNLLTTLVQAGRPLPWATTVVKSLSDLLLQDWWLLLGAIVIAATMVGAALRTAPGRQFWHRLQLRLPVLGDMVRKQAILRIATIIATLLKSGMEFPKALDMAQRSTKNQLIHDALARCQLAINAGRDIAEALESTGAFPPTVVRIFSVGQQSGRLEEMLDRLVSDYDRQLSIAAQRLTGVLEPVLILLLALLVGFIAFATVLPILEASRVL